MRHVWTSPATARLREIERYVSDRDAGAASRLVSRIGSAVAQLEHHPELGRPGRRAGTRELTIARTSYLVVYRLVPARIEILAVFHSRQNRPDLS